MAKTPLPSQNSSLIKAKASSQRFTLTRFHACMISTDKFSGKRIVAFRRSNNPFKATLICLLRDWALRRRQSYSNVKRRHFFLKWTATNVSNMGTQGIFLTWRSFGSLCRQRSKSWMACFASSSEKWRSSRFQLRHKSVQPEIENRQEKKERNETFESRGFMFLVIFVQDNIAVFLHSNHPIKFRQFYDLFNATFLRNLNPITKSFRNKRPESDVPYKPKFHRPWISHVHDNKAELLRWLQHSPWKA